MITEWKDDDVNATQCMRCANRTRGAQGCKAFAVIPQEIILNEFDHRSPYPGDNGVQFVSRMGPAKDRWFLPVMQNPMKV